MRALRGALTGLGAAAVLAAALSRFAGAEPVELTLDQARQVAQEAFRQGDMPLANALGHGLLKANPEDTTALLVLAATEPLLGRPAAGRKAGRLAFGTATDPSLKWEAAYLTSRAALAEERYTAAQYWLRRAYQRAETDVQRDRVADAFQQVRRISPWTARFSFDVAPNSNVNGGASSEFLVIDDTLPVGILSGAARALSGVTATLSADASYALSRSPDHLTTVSGRFYRTFNSLSEEAQDIAPRAKGSDFDYQVAEVQLTHRLAEAPGLLPDRYALALGQTWYGGEELDRVIRATLSRRFEIGPTFSARLSGELESRLSDRDAADRDGTEIRVDFLKQLPAGHLVSLSAWTTDVQSEDINSEYTGNTVQLGLTLGEDIMGLRFSGYVGWSAKDYQDYRIGFFRIVEGRHDEEWTAGIDMALENVSYMGFTPVVSVNGRQSTSNISRYAGESYGLSVGFRSAF